MENQVDGYWLPWGAREKLISPGTAYHSLSFNHGRPCPSDDPEAISARWPQLRLDQWHILLDTLDENRKSAPRGEQLWYRLLEALKIASRRLADPTDKLHRQALIALPKYTGFSQAMIRFTLTALDLMSLEQFPLAFSLPLLNQAATYWQRLPGLHGRLRFFSANLRQLAQLRLPGMMNRPLFSPAPPARLVVGYGAGNVPGTALLMTLLSLATSLASGELPAVVIKNSRREPIFSPLVLRALEEADPEIISTLAVLIWDYEDAEVQNLLLGRADLVIAAASDETLHQVKKQLAKARPKHPSKSGKPVRFHAHGHKVSFSAITRQALESQLSSPDGSQAYLDIISLLAALDSAFWDQFGCLSSRIHFVEIGDKACHTPLEYAERLTAAMRLLAQFLPRGAWPLQHIHDRFDRYKQLETTKPVQVLSSYEDEFLIVLDQRPLSPRALHSLVNDCQGRVIVVRPVSDLMEIPEQYLRFIPPANLQSLSVATGRPGEKISERFLRFAEACGARGVTAIRTIGRGAFPQLAYSWDGFIPLDLVYRRPRGYFTSIEFDDPGGQILETYQLLMQRMNDFVSK